LSAGAQTTVSYAPVSQALKVPPAVATITKTSYSASSGLLLTISCHAGGAACAGSLSAIAKQKLTIRTKKGKKKTKIKQITVAAGHFSIAAGQTKTLKLKISSAAAALLKRLGSLPATITLSLDQAGNTHTTITERFTLKPTKPKKPKGKSHKKH